jgi:hypothetical protein
LVAKVRNYLALPKPSTRLDLLAGVMLSIEKAQYHFLFLKENAIC